MIISTFVLLSLPTLANGFVSYFDWKRSFETILYSAIDDDVRSTSSASSDSLSHFVSSPERYAAALEMTLEDVNRMIQKRKDAVRALNDALETSTNPAERRRLVLEHRYQHGKHPFVCRRCWSYKPICMCSSSNSSSLKTSSRTTSSKADIPCRAIAIWTHQNEWGSPSNTGSMLPLLLQDCYIWMNGRDDSNLNNLVDGNSDDDVQPVVLWPEDANKTQQRSPSICLDSLTPDQIEKLAVVVPEGTWRQARRLASKLPKHWPRVSLNERAVSKVFENGQASSLLAPLRCRNKAPINSVCTAEAVVAVLLSMGLEEKTGRDVLSKVKQKVDLTRRYQGKAMQQNDSSNV